MSRPPSSPLAFAVLGGLFLFLPYITTNWFHVNSRVMAYLWIRGVFCRLPDQLDVRLLQAARRVGGRSTRWAWA